MTANLFIKNATIITMDPSLGTLHNTDMMISDSLIVRIGAHLDVYEEENSEIVDASGMIVIPGFIDTHRHVWESLVRNIGADWSLNTYMQHIYYGGYGSRLRVEDSYIANYLGAMEAINAGITTLLDWNMTYSSEHTDEFIRGLQRSGIRAVYALGASGEREYLDRESRLTTVGDIKRVSERFFNSKDQLLTLGLAIRGPEYSHWDTFVEEINIGRDYGALISMHLGVGNWGAQQRSITKMFKEGLLAPDINIVHGNMMGDDEFKMMADTGASLSVTPEIEMMMGHGYPVTGKMIEAGGVPSLGIDVVTSTAGDMFGQMRFALQAERAKVNQEMLEEGGMPDQLKLTAYDVLNFATIGGAKALGLDHKVGSLTPGKEADFLLISTKELNMFPIHDPIGAAVQFANPSNVDSVYIAGKAMKRGGVLINTEMDSLRKKATASAEFILGSRGASVSSH